ncbi:MAG: pantetheine-phosphate adenylyltransferase [Treponema sp.]|nr:pantetheine-phosphate adenylyltransferase [Treponema sp.]
MVKAVFAGSFDPPTYGHLNVIERASKLFDCVDVVISVNPDKKYMFNENERFEMLSEMIKPFSNVELHIWDGLIVKYAEQVGAKVLVRGIRTQNDFLYEFDLALMNKALDANIETMFIPTDEEFAIVKSSSIKELAKFGGNISKMVPPNVEETLRRKLEKSGQ